MKTKQLCTNRNGNSKPVIDSICKLLNISVDEYSIRLFEYGISIQQKYYEKQEYVLLTSIFWSEVEDITSCINTEIIEHLKNKTFFPNSLKWFFNVEIGTGSFFKPKILALVKQEYREKYGKNPTAKKAISTKTSTKKISLQITTLEPLNYGK